MPAARRAIAALSLSAAAFVGIALHEGYAPTAMQPLPGDKLTHGFGTTTRPDGSPLRPGDTTTPTAALAAKLRDVRAFEGALRGCITAPLTQGEYDALVSIAYNVGASAICRSTMAARFNAGQYAAACAEFSRWVYYQRRDCRIPANRCAGLVQRRAAERAQCEGAA